MAGAVDLWGWMFVVFGIVAGMVVVIKVLLEFPGLLQWKCVYTEHNHPEDSEPYRHRVDVERGRVRSPKMSSMSSTSSSRVISAVEMKEMNHKTDHVHWHREGNNHHHHEANNHQEGERRNNHERERSHRQERGERRGEGRGKYEGKVKERVHCESEREVVATPCKRVTVANIESCSATMESCSPGEEPVLRLVPSTHALSRQC
jgi:hypothetical protein